MEESERKNPRLKEEEGRGEEGKRKGVRVMVKGGCTDIDEVRTSLPSGLMLHRKRSGDRR